MNRQPIAVLVGKQLYRGCQLFDQCGDVDVLDVELDPTRLDLGEVEHVVDQVQEVSSRSRDPLQGLDVVAEPVVPGFLFQHLGEADDGVQRRAQLVAHVGQELTLRPGGIHRAVPRERQVVDQVRKLGFALLDLRDVGVDADDACVVGHHLLDLDEYSAAETKLDRAQQIVSPPGKKLFRGALPVRKHAALVGSPEDRLAVAAGDDEPGDLLTRGVREVLLVVAVAKEESIFTVEDDEPLRDRLERLAELDTRFQRLVAHGGELIDELAELALALLDLGNIRVDRYHSAVVCPPFRGLQPGSTGEVELDRASRAVALLASAFEIVFEVERDIGKHATLERGSQDVLERCARHDLPRKLLPHRVGVVVPVRLVAKKEAIIGIEQREAFRDGLDSVAQLRLRPFQLVCQSLLLRHVARPSHHAIGPPVLVAAREAMVAHPTQIAFFAAVAVLELEAIGQTLEVFGVSVQESGQIVRMDAFQPVFRGLELSSLQPQHLLESGRVVDGIVGNIPVVDALTDDFEGEVLAALASPERRFRLGMAFLSRRECPFGLPRVRNVPTGDEQPALRERVVPGQQDLPVRQIALQPA